MRSFAEQKAEANSRLVKRPFRLFGPTLYDATVSPNFSRANLTAQMEQMIAFYNKQVDEFIAHLPKTKKKHWFSCRFELKQYNLKKSKAK